MSSQATDSGETLARFASRYSELAETCALTHFASTTWNGSSAARLRSRRNVGASYRRSKAWGLCLTCLSLACEHAAGEA